MADDRAPLRFAPPSKCAHANRTIEDDQPEIRCDDCGVVLDPYWCLRDLAKWQAWSDQRLAELLAVEKRIADHDAKERLKLVNRRARQLKIRGVVGDGA